MARIGSTFWRDVFWFVVFVLMVGSLATVVLIVVTKENTQALPSVVGVLPEAKVVITQTDGYEKHLELTVSGHLEFAGLVSWYSINNTPADLGRPSVFKWLPVEADNDGPFMVFCKRIHVTKRDAPAK